MKLVIFGICKKVTVLRYERCRTLRQKDSLLHQLLPIRSHRYLPLERCENQFHHMLKTNFQVVRCFGKDVGKKLTSRGSFELVRFFFSLPLPRLEKSAEGREFAFPFQRWCPHPRTQTVRSQCSSILFFRWNKMAHWIIHRTQKNWEILCNFFVWIYLWTFLWMITKNHYVTSNSVPFSRISENVTKLRRIELNFYFVRCYLLRLKKATRAATSYLESQLPQEEEAPREHSFFNSPKTNVPKTGERALTAAH